MKKQILNFFLVLLSLITIVTASAYIKQKPTEHNILLIGDSGKNNKGQLDVSNAMFEYCRTKDCHLGLLAGDIIYPVGLQNEKDRGLETFFDKYYNKLNIPFLISLGNHDYGKLTNSWNKGSYHLLHQYRNKHYVFPHYYYVHETEFAVFAVIDTTKLMWRRETFAQRQMLIEAHKKAKAKEKWFIVLGHHPYLSNGKHGNAGLYERLRVPYFASGSNVEKVLKRYVCGKADFYLAGHDHSLQVLDGNQKNCDTTLIVSGAAASTSKLFKWNNAEFESLEKGFFALSMNEKRTIVQAYNQKNELLFEKLVFKKTQE